MSCFLCKNIKEQKVKMSCDDSYCVKCFNRIIFINQIHVLQEGERIRVRCKCPRQGFYDTNLQYVYKSLISSLESEEIDAEKCLIHPKEEKALYCRDCGYSICHLCAKDTEHFDHIKADNAELRFNLRDFLHSLPLSYKTVEEFMKHFEGLTNTIKVEIEKSYSMSIKKIDDIIQTMTLLRVEYAKKMKEKLEHSVLLLKCYKLFYGSYYFDYDWSNKNDNINDLKYLKDISKELTEAQVVMDQEVVSKLNSLKTVSEELRNCTNDKGVFDIKFTFKEMARQLNQVDKLFGHKKIVYCVIQLKDGRLCTGSEDYSIRFWEEKNGQFENTITLSESTGKVIFLLQLRDERIISSAKDNLTVRVWVEADHDGKYRIEQTLQSHNESVSAMLQMSDNTLVTASRDKTIKIWGTSTQMFHSIQTLTEHKEGVFALCEISNGRLASGSHDRLILIWAEKDAAYHCTHTLIGHTNRVRTIFLMKDGRLMSGGDDCNIFIWKECGEAFTLVSNFAAHHQLINCAIQLKDGRVVTGSKDKSLRVWVETPKGWNKKEVHRDHSTNVFSIIQLQDGRLASSSDNQVIIWRSGIMIE